MSEKNNLEFSSSSIPKHYLVKTVQLKKSTESVCQMSIKPSSRTKKLTLHCKYRLLKPELDKISKSVLSLGSAKFTESLTSLKVLTDSLTND